MKNKKLGIISLTLVITALFLVSMVPMVPAQEPPAPVDPALYEAELRPGESVTLTKYITIPEIPANPDIYFLCDTTGSMGPVITQMKSDASAIMTDILAVQPDAQFGVGNYKDFPYDSYAFDHQQAITSDTTAVNTAISAWIADGGYDTAEGQFYALTKLATDATIGWRTDSTKIVVLFGDAPAHDPVPMAATGLGYDITQATVITDLTAAGIKFVAIDLWALEFVPTSYGGNYATAYGITEDGSANQASTIATATGGAYLYLPDPAAVADAIISALGQLTTDVWWETSCCASELTVTLTPEVHYDVAGGTTVQFGETIEVAEDAMPGDCTCSVNFYANHYPEAGVLIGTQEIIIHVLPRIDVTKEIVDADIGEPGDPFYVVPLFTNAWWDLEINVENCVSEVLDEIWVYDSIGAHIKLVVQGEETDEDIVTDATEMDLRTQTNFCWTHDEYDPNNILSATLTIRAYDIDYYDPYWEEVEILADDVSLGLLENTGNNKWGETVFNIDDLSILEDGAVEVCVNWDDETGYLSTIDWSKLTVEHQYIFKIDGIPVPLGDDDIFFGNYDDEIIWRQANKKTYMKNPCATNLMWYIDELDIGESSTLGFRVETISYEVGKGKTKQAFTSTCHHSLNDGAVAVDDGDVFCSNAVEVSVYDTDLEADSDGDGICDMEEIEAGCDTYITDPCCKDTDGDGYEDGYEIDHDSDPTDPDCYPPSFDNADLIYWTSEDSTEYPAYVPDYPDYEMELDESVDWFYLNLDDVEIDGLPLQDGYYGFDLTPPDLADPFWTWWATPGRDVTEAYALANPDSWQAVMWDILNGDLPMFYIKVSNCGTEYMLVDGLQYELFYLDATAFGLTTCDNPFRVNGGYPLGIYTVTGIIENQCGAWEDVTITMDFSRWVSLETIQVPGTNPGPTYSSVLVSDNEYRLVASGTYRFATWGEYGIADAAWNYRSAAYAPGGVAGWYQQASGALQVKVDGSVVTWEPATYNPAHIYTYDVTGDGTTLEFTIYDNAYGDNSGYITVDIYEWV